LYNIFEVSAIILNKVYRHLDKIKIPPIIILEIDHNYKVESTLTNILIISLLRLD